MKNLTIAFALLLTCNLSFSQTDSTLYYFEEVGMFVKVPARFQIISADEAEKTRRNGEKLLEEANDVDLDFSEVKDLLSVREGTSNSLNVTITPYAKNGETWKEEFGQVKEMVYNSFAEKIDPEKIETVSSNATIDGLNFEKFEVTINVSIENQVKMILLSKYYKGYDFGICYVFADKIVGKEFETIISNSKFKK